MTWKTFEEYSKTPYSLHMKQEVPNLPPEKVSAVMSE